MLGPRWLLENEGETLDFAHVFGRTAPVTLEIGFGNGESLATQARQSPERDFIGVEVHRPGVGHLLQLIDRLQLDNLRLFNADAAEILEKRIAPASLAAIQVFFPDPWPKKRHHKRRLIQPAFIALLASRLAPGGRLHLATDWIDYAEHMLDVLETEPALINQYGSRAWAPRPLDRPLTKFEQRGQRLGHAVCDLVFRRL